MERVIRLKKSWIMYLSVRTFSIVNTFVEVLLMSENDEMKQIIDHFILSTRAARNSYQLMFIASVEALLSNSVGVHSIV